MIVADNMREIPYAVIYFDQKGNVTGREAHNLEKAVMEDYAVERIARVLLDDVREYYSDPANMAEYERWETDQRAKAKAPAKGKRSGRRQ